MVASRRGVLYGRKTRWLVDHRLRLRVPKVGVVVGVAAYLAAGIHDGLPIRRASTSCLCKKVASTPLVPQRSAGIVTCTRLARHQTSLRASGRPRAGRLHGDHVLTLLVDRADPSPDSAREHVLHRGGAPLRDVVDGAHVEELGGWFTVSVVGSVRSPPSLSR